MGGVPSRLGAKKAEAAGAVATDGVAMSRESLEDLIRCGAHGAEQKSTSRVLVALRSVEPGSAQGRVRG
jgi:hypothetical protein